MIDEEAEKALFAAAVAEWRGETPKDQPVRVKIIRNGQEVQRIETGGVGGQQSLPAQSITKANADASMWTNPFGPGPTSSDLFDDDDDDDDTPNTGATGGGAKTDQSFLPPIASPSQSPAKAQGLAGAGGAASGGLRAASLQVSLNLSLRFKGYCSILLTYYFMWSGALDSSDLLQSYSIISLAYHIPTILISILF